MIQQIFSAPIPVVVYVAPSGATATSAGVFITLAAHVAAMAPGTSIGAAHPVQGDGKDIQGDMRAKAENMTVAMVRALSEQRGRNVGWAEKAVTESSSITEKEALSTAVVDIVAGDLDDLLTQVSGREVKINQRTVVLGDYSKLPRREIAPSFGELALNVLGNPNVAALLWLAASTGLMLELYHPGAILPGVVGVISLILALAVSQIIPLSQSGILLIVLGVLLLGAELFFPSGILAVGGLIALGLGAMYLVDVSLAPGMGVSLQVFLPIAILVAALVLLIVSSLIKSRKTRVTTGREGLVGMNGKALEPVAESGAVFVNGEIWKATAKSGLIGKEDQIRVVRVLPGLVLEVERI